MEGRSKKEKGPMDMDNNDPSVAGDRCIRGLNGDGKNTIKKLKVKKIKSSGESQTCMYMKGSCFSCDLINN